MERKTLGGLVLTMVLVLLVSTAAFANGAVVKEGARGDEVRAVQTLLIDQGYLTGTADGVCGKMTVMAICHFQKAQGLTVDGVCGLQTYRALCGDASAELTSEPLPSGAENKGSVPSDTVRTVQTLLIDQGYLTGIADGICGKMTTAAICHFQRDHGLAADGICGSQTYQALCGDSSVQPMPEPAAADAVDSAGKKLHVSATGYSAQDPGNSLHTASGTLLRHGVIAVDPRIIALGTHVYIPGYGEAVAEDIGTGIRGNTIDIAFNTHSEALHFGRREMDIEILDE